MWSKIKLPAKAEVAPTEGYVTLGRGFVRFGVTACSMIPDLAQFPYAEFLRDNENPNLIGVAFRSEQVEDSLPVTLLKSKSVRKKMSDGITISGREELTYIFGAVVLNNLRAKKVVTLDSTQSNTLVIHMDRDWVNPNPRGPVIDS